MNGSGRESIWSVPREAKLVYVTVFAILFGSGLGVLWYRSIGQADDWLDKLVEGWNNAGPRAIVSAAVAMILAEGLVGVMVLSEGLRNRLKREREARREEGRQQGREEGRQQGRQQGHQEGRQQGRQEGRQQTLEIVREVRKKFPDDPAMEEVERRLREVRQ